MKATLFISLSLNRISIQELFRWVQKIVSKFPLLWSLQPPQLLQVSLFSSFNFSVVLVPLVDYLPAYRQREREREFVTPDGSKT